MASDCHCTQDVLLDFLCARGGRVTNAELLARFRGFLRGDVDVQVRETHRQLFKRFVNSVAFVERDAAGVAFVVLKRRYRELVGEECDLQTEPQDECNSDWECPTVGGNARPLWEYKEDGCRTARLEPLTDCQNDMNLMNLQRPLGRQNCAECSDIDSNRTAQQPTTVLLQHNNLDTNEQNFSVDQWMSHGPDHQLENSAMHLSNQQSLKVPHDESENICPRLAPHLSVEQALNWKQNSLTALDPPIADTSKERQLDISKSKDERHKSKTSEIARRLMSQSCSPPESPLQVQNARLGNKAEDLGKNKHQLRTDFTSHVMKTENLTLGQSARCSSVTDIHKLNTKHHAQSVDKLILGFNENESFTSGQNARKYYSMAVESEHVPRQHCASKELPEMNMKATHTVNDKKKTTSYINHVQAADRLLPDFCENETLAPGQNVRKYHSMVVELECAPHEECAYRKSPEPKPMHTYYHKRKNTNYTDNVQTAAFNKNETLSLGQNMKKCHSLAMEMNCVSLQECTSKKLPEPNLKATLSHNHKMKNSSNIDSMQRTTYGKDETIIPGQNIRRHQGIALEMGSVLLQECALKKPAEPKATCVYNHNKINTSNTDLAVNATCKNSFQFSNEALSLLKNNTVPLDTREHEWLVKAAIGNWNEIYGLFKEEPSLILKKDFISGYTVLHWLAMHGDHRVLNTLCYGASKAKLPIDVNVRSTGGYTPLHLAVMYKRKKTIKMLVQSYKANVNLRDNSGRKPWQYLEKTGSLDLRYLLGAPLGKLKNDTVSRQSSTDKSALLTKESFTPALTKNSFLASFLKPPYLWKIASSMSDSYEL